MQQVRQIRENIHNTNAQRSWNGDQGDDFAAQRTWVNFLVSGDTVGVNDALEDTRESVRAVERRWSLLRRHAVQDRRNATSTVLLDKVTTTYYLPQNNLS